MKRLSSLGGSAYLPAALSALAGICSLVFQWYRSRPLWLDEEMIALNLRDRALDQLAGPLWMNQAAPFGWLALQRAILVEFGATERTLRAAPVLFGCASLVLAFWAGRRWMGPIGATIFVLLCSFARFMSSFPVDVKHYSADVLFGLLLPILAVDALASDRPTRIDLWWLVAAAALWFANGAVFVVPACAAALGAAAWRRGGWRTVARVAAPGVIWIASFAVHYSVSIGPAVQNHALQDYWSSALPPATWNPLTVLQWLAAHLQPLAVNPGGTQRWILFWVAALGGAGLAATTSVALGFVLLAVPVSAFLLAALRAVPLADRLALWAVPALYAGIAIAGDVTTRTAWQSFTYRQWLRGVVPACGAVIALTVVVDVVRSGAHQLSILPLSKYNLDDRAALRLLTSMHEPGDALVTGHLGLPAVWWYADVNVASPNLGASYQKDASPILEVQQRAEADCGTADQTAALRGRSRALVYLGYGSRVPDGLEEQVLDTLAQLGKMTTYRPVAEEGLVAIFDFRQPPEPWEAMFTNPSGQAPQHAPRPRGCVGFSPAVRW